MQFIIVIGREGGCGAFQTLEVKRIDYSRQSSANLSWVRRGGLRRSIIKLKISSRFGVSQTIMVIPNALKLAQHRAAIFYV